MLNITLKRHLMYNFIKYSQKMMKEKQEQKLMKKELIKIMKEENKLLEDSLILIVIIDFNYMLLCKIIKK